MKSYFKIGLIAVFIGGIIAFLFYKDINNKVKALVKKDETISLFQIGVFKDKENANKFSEENKPSIIYNDDNYYRVIMAVSYSNEAKIKMESYLKSKNIDYYIKEINVNKDFIETLKNYETVLLKSNNDEVLNNINNNVLKLFDSYIN